MTVENANAFLDELKANGPSAKLMSKIGKDFQPEHMQEALKSQEILDKETLKGFAGGDAGQTAGAIMNSGVQWAQDNQKTIEVTAAASSAAA